MNQIVKKLELQKTTNVELAFYPGEKGMNGVLTCKAPLTLEAAKVLGCSDRFFTIHDVPYHDFQGRLTLERMAKNCKVTFGDPAQRGATSLLPDMVWKFSIGLEKDAQPSVSWRMHFDSQYRGELTEMVHGLGKTEIDFEMVALQQTLFDEEDAEQGEGTRVDLSSKQMNLDDEGPDTGCISCNNGLPVDAKGKHLNGEKCTNRDREGKSPGTLASAREVAGGTTEEAKKARGRRPTVPINGKAAAHPTV
jgi:hypothetical protein